MSLITLNMPSSMLKKQTEVCICVPNRAEDGKPMTARKVLWLLHGLSDDNTCWQRFSNIERYANDSGTVVVMPDGDRSMYMDNVSGQNYKRFITEELPQYLHFLFGLSEKRENNFIAGLSMGGMGAAKIALANPDKYAGFGSFSGLLDLKYVKAAFMPQMNAEFPFMNDVFDATDYMGEDAKTLLDKNLHSDMKMYIACGTEDYWIKASESFKEKADAFGMDVKYVFEKGGHEWSLWDRNVRRFIDYINE